jgi:hypothetical protein
MNADFVKDLENRPYFRLIKTEYEGKFARRSGVPYLNHTVEGAYIIHLLFEPDEEIAEAYCLHPLFQSDRILARMLTDDPSQLSQISPRIVALAMEYRRVANAYTLTDALRSPDAIDLGPLEQVHKMLTADKIQNKKDFMKHLYGKHERPSYKKTSERTVDYFNSWLTRLGISEETYGRIVEEIEM